MPCSGLRRSKGGSVLLWLAIVCRIVAAVEARSPADIGCLHASNRILNRWHMAVATLIVTAKRHYGRGARLEWIIGRARGRRWDGDRRRFGDSVIFLTSRQGSRTDTAQQGSLWAINREDAASIADVGPSKRKRSSR